MKIVEKKKTKIVEKKKPLSMKEKIEKIEAKIKNIQSDLSFFDTKQNNLRRNIKSNETKLKFLVNKQTAEINVLEKDGKWGDYTGVFYTTSKDSTEIITNKALSHFNTYFKDDKFFKKRTLGLFITSPEGKKLIKVLQDKENKYTEYGYDEIILKKLSDKKTNGGKNETK